MTKRILLLLQGFVSLWLVPYIAHVVDAQATDWWQGSFYFTLTLWAMASVAAFTWSVTEFMIRD